MADSPEAPETETGDEAILVRARTDYERAREAWNDNIVAAKDDLRFGRLEEQWPEKIRKQREIEGRPCLTFSKIATFIRQVVNDARQNKPQIKVHPQDSGADPRVAEIYNGLIRNIETTSDADVAYDTAIEHAVGQGFGYWRYNTKYTCDDAFDQDIVCERICNPFTVYGDPRSTAADSSDWNVAFIITSLTKDEFEREYPNAEKTDWDHDFKDCPEWLDGDDVTVAEYWTREKVKGEIVALSDGQVVKVADLEKSPENFVGLTVVGQPREVETYKVTQRIMSGAEVLKTVEWAGKYIPIVPVYGDEVTDETGKRHFRSLIRSAKGAQQMFNYMRTTGVEGLALQPRVPYIGEEGSFDCDPNWDTANNVSHSKLEYKKGAPPPQRQPLPNHFGAAFQEALSASDDMKAIIGIYDASLGARSNETSGRAIMARQREGDVSTFHFIDNLSRAIRHGGRILLDLIPKVYTTERIVRVLGEDMQPQTVQVAPTGQPVSEQQTPEGQSFPIYDLTAGKYDLTVSAGPSFTTRREENREMMIEAMQAGGDAVAPVLLPRIAKLMDMPDADEIAAEINQRMNPQPQGGVPPEVQQQIQEGMQLIQQQQGEIQTLKADQQGKIAEYQLKSRELDIKEQELQIKFIEAQTRRIAAEKPTVFKGSPSTQPGTA